MRFPTDLIPARLIRRYKRFLADCQLEDGREITAHVANPGSMMGLATPGARVWLEPNDDPKRKLKFAWKLLEIEAGGVVCVDTGLANRLVKEALAARKIAAFADAGAARAEVKFGEKSRVDFLLDGGEGKTWVEVKSVTLSRQPGLAEFPDSVTARGARHLADLTQMVRQGDAAAMLYVVMRTDCTSMTIAGDIDPAYAQAFVAAREAGVAVHAVAAQISPAGLEMGDPVPVGDPA